MENFQVTLEKMKQGQNLAQVVAQTIDNCNIDASTTYEEMHDLVGWVLILEQAAAKDSNYGT